MDAMTTANMITEVSRNLRDLNYNLYSDSSANMILQAAIRGQTFLCNVLPNKYLTEIIRVAENQDLNDGKILLSQIYRQEQQTLISTADTYINDAATTTNYGADTSMVSCNPAEGATRRILIKFDMSILDASTVNAAKLRLYGVIDTATPFNVFRLLRNWVETGATWTAYSAGNNWGTAGALNSTTDYDNNDLCATTLPIKTTAGWMELVLDPALVKAMCGASPSITAYGFKIIDNTQTHVMTVNTRENADYKPQLEITFEKSSINVVGGEAGIIDVKINGGSYCDLIRPIDRKRYTNNTLNTPTSGDPKAWVVDRSINVLPSTTEAVDITYKECPPDMVSGGQGPTLNPAFHKLVCKLAEFYCRETLHEQGEGSNALIEEARKDAFGEIKTLIEKEG